MIKPKSIYNVGKKVSRKAYVATLRSISSIARVGIREKKLKDDLKLLTRSQ